YRQIKGIKVFIGNLPVAGLQVGAASGAFDDLVDGGTKNSQCVCGAAGPAEKDRRYRIGLDHLVEVELVETKRFKLIDQGLGFGRLFQLQVNKGLVNQPVNIDGTSFLRGQRNNAIM